MKRLLAISLALLATAGGCARPGSGGWGTAHELRVGIVNDPSSLNPLFVTSQNAVDMGQLYTETLVGLSPQNRLVPLLASEIPTRENGGISRDGLTLTYHLRPDARFADGVAVTSADVAFTYRVILDPRNPVTAAEPYRQIRALQTPDARTVRIVLRRKWAAAASELFAESDYAFGILPAHAFRSTDLAHSGWNQLPFGSGPFKVTRWKHGDSIELEPNPYARRKPRLRRLIYKILPDTNTLFVQLRTHQIDVASVTDKQVARARALPGVRVVETPQNHTDFIVFQTQSPPLDDIRVRRALARAIDREAIRRSVYLGLHPLASTEIPASLWAHDAGVTAYAYDPSRARAELLGAGFPNAQVQFAYIGTSEDSRLLATIVQANLAKVGVTATLRSYPSTLFFAPASAGGIERSGRFHLAYSDWFGGADPEQSETYRCADMAPAGPNTARWCSAVYDALYRRQAETADTPARAKIFAQMQRIVREAAVDLPLVYQSSFTAINASVRGYSPNMLFSDGNAEEWDVAGT